VNGQRVAIIGGGVAGMSAAHELVERGFAVTVLERKDIPGGKARSLPVKGSGTEGRRPLPGEHGFRFFPGFYRHLPDTMMRIPYGGQLNGVFDNLVEATEIEMRSTTQRDLIAAGFPKNAVQLGIDLTAAIRDVVFGDPGISVADVVHFAGRILAVLTSCDERRIEQLENQSWWEFCDAPRRSRKYQEYLADGLSRTLVAVKARDLSARTGGVTLAQLLLGLITPGACSDRLLNGPTNDVWIDPWLRYLTARGVDYRPNALVTDIGCDGRRITGVTYKEDGGDVRIDGSDHYVAAVPIEAMQEFVRRTPGLVIADPQLARLDELRTSWMNGVQFYLRSAPALVHGHSLYIDSPWALTSISQQQFWRGIDLRAMGDGRATGILSVIVSDWDTPGELHPKPAKECSSAELISEVRHQLVARGVPGLSDANVVREFVDDDVQEPNPNRDTNAEPLLINTVGSWSCRPAATTAIANLFLASDYVRTNTDVATMEAANEAARRAVNAILHAAGSTARRCEVWRLHEPRVLAPLRALDRRRFQEEQARAARKAAPFWSAPSGYRAQPWPATPVDPAVPPLAELDLEGVAERASRTTLHAG
jgi:uncharacterized protein with NAD-binding domain and iron-sulfur cluster